MNSYTYEMFRETFEIFDVWIHTRMKCSVKLFIYVLQKYNAYEIVVFDWSMPIIVTSFKMGDTRGLPHSQNNVLT